MTSIPGLRRSAVSVHHLAEQVYSGSHRLDISWAIRAAAEDDPPVRWGVLLSFGAMGAALVMLAVRP